MSWPSVGIAAGLEGGDGGVVGPVVGPVVGDETVTGEMELVDVAAAPDVVCGALEQPAIAAIPTAAIATAARVDA